MAKYDYPYQNVRLALECLVLPESNESALAAAFMWLSRLWGVSPPVAEPDEADALVAWRTVFKFARSGQTLEERARTMTVEERSEFGRAIFALHNWLRDRRDD